MVSNQWYTIPHKITGFFHAYTNSGYQALLDRNLGYGLCMVTGTEVRTTMYTVGLVLIA